MSEEIFSLLDGENKVKYLSIPEIEKDENVKTFFTTRIGGVSENHFSSLNFGGITDDKPENVKENRRRVFEALQIAPRSLVFPRQVHKDLVYQLKEEDVSSSDNVTIPDTDAVITNIKNVMLTTIHADCPPVYLYAPDVKAIGLVHSGWRGTHLGIAAKTLALMADVFHIDKKNVVAVIGPCISKCCFEVGAEVYQAFQDTYSYIDDFAELTSYNMIDTCCGELKYHIDLKGIIERQLKNAGVVKIYKTAYCTSCNDDLFFSHRREKGFTGRMGAGMMLI